MAEQTVSPTSSTSRVPTNPGRVIRKFLMDESSYMTTLLAILIDTYGTEALEWHPETIRQQLEADYNLSLPQFAHDRIMAGVTLLTTDLFYKSASRFVDLCNVIAGAEFDPNVFDPADPYECAWAVTEALLLAPPEDDDDEPFDDEIRRYLGFVLRDEGFVKPPDVLQIALDADFSDKVRYDFSDDPEMFQGVYETQASKTDEVTTMIRGNLEELIQQLEDLPLRNGDTKDLVRRARQSKSS